MMQENGGLSHRKELASHFGIVTTDHSRTPIFGSSATMCWLVGAAILAAFLSLGLYHLVLQDRPETYDTASYLLEANRISESGGLSAFPRMVAEGEWKQANQHPLYILAIAPFAEFDFGFVVSAKLVSLFFGALTVLASYIIALWYFNPLIAALATVGIALTSLFIRWSAFVACESLLLLLSTLATAAILMGFRDKRYWVFAGLLAGLAYLTKVTALLLLPGFFIAALLSLRLEIFRTREVYLFLAMFLLGCSPLLISNTIVHGNPIYNSNIDNLSDPFAGVIYKESSIERGSDIWVRGPVEKHLPVTPTDSTALSEIAGLVSGIATRLPRESVMFLETFSPWPLNSGPIVLRWAFGTAILALFLIGIFREPDAGARHFVLLTVVVFLVALSIHRPIERYLLPLHFLVWVYAATGVNFLLYKYGQRFRDRLPAVTEFMKLGIAAACILLSAYVLGTKNVVARVPDSVSVASHREVLIDWMRENLGEDDRYVEGPNLSWVLENGKHLSPPARVRSSQDEFFKFLRKYDVKYVIAEMESMQLWRFRGRIDRQIKFDGILEFDPQRGIIELDIPEGWAKVAVDEEGIVEFIVYEVSLRVD